MISAPLGNVFTLKLTVTNAAGVPTDAATVTFTVKPPVGANTTGAPTRHTGTGTYEFDHKPAVGGTHQGEVATLSPDSDAQSAFYVEASNTA